MMMRFLVLPLMWLVSTRTASAQLDCTFRSATTLEDAPNLTLRHMVNPVEETVTLELRYAGSGWLGLGFSETGLMVGSTAVVGRPLEGTVGSVFLAGYSPDAVNPVDSSSLTNAVIEETADNETILRFTKPLLEPGQVAVSPDAPNTLIYAVGSTSAWGSFHARQGSVTLTLDACLEEDQTATTPIPPAATTTTVEELHEKDMDEVAPLPPANPPADRNPSSSTSSSTPPPPSTNLDDKNPDDWDCTLYSEVEILPNQLLTLRHVTHPVEETVTMELVYASGQGYLALAFSEDGFMVGNTAVIGLPDANTVRKYFLGGQSTSAVRLVADAAQTLTHTVIQQNETHTVLRFTKPLVEPDEVPVSASGVNRLIFAVGDSNRLGWHTEHGAFDLTLAPCLAVGDEAPHGDGATETADLFNTQAPHEDLWRIHGLLMGAAWGVLIPLAVGASLARNVLPQGLWFALHRGLNGLALLCNIAGFGIAVHLIGDSPGAQHFRDDNHQMIGLVIFVAVVLQAMLGLVRPHGPSKDEEPENEDKLNPTTHASDRSHDSGPSSQSPPSSPSATPTKPLMRVVWEIKHRVVGVALIGLAWYNAQTGIDLFHERFGDDMTVFFWAVTGVIAGGVGVLTVVSKQRPT